MKQRLFQETRQYPSGRRYSGLLSFTVSSARTTDGLRLQLLIAAVHTIQRLLEKIAKTGLECKFPITTIAFVINAPARFAVEDISVFYHFPQFRPDPETEFTLLKIVNRIFLHTIDS